MGGDGGDGGTTWLAARDEVAAGREEIDGARPAMGGRGAMAAGVKSGNFWTPRDRDRDCGVRVRERGCDGVVWVRRGAAEHR